MPVKPQVKAGWVKFRVNLITSDVRNVCARLRPGRHFYPYEPNQLINLTPRGLKSFSLGAPKLKSFSEVLQHG